MASSSSEVTVLDAEAVERILLGEDLEITAPVVDDPGEAQRQIVARILAAASADEVLASQDTISAGELVDIPFAVLGVRWLQSRIADASVGVFALASGTRGDTGEAVLVTTGAVQVMAQLHKLQQLGAIPGEDGQGVVVIVRRKKEPTAAGYYPIWLEAVPSAA